VFGVSCLLLTVMIVLGWALVALLVWLLLWHWLLLLALLAAVFAVHRWDRARSTLTGPRQ
jgi:hypothetical protein